MVSLLLALAAPASATPILMDNGCSPDPCMLKIIWSDGVIEPPWLVAEDRRVGGLRSLEISVQQISGLIGVTVNGYFLDAHYLISDVRGVQTYRVPVQVTDTVGVQIQNLGTTPIAYEVQINGSNQPSPAP